MESTQKTDIPIDNESILDITTHKMNDVIESELEVTEEELETTTAITKAGENPFDLDADEAIKNMKKMIKEGDMSLRMLVSLARQSESPRAYEVLATFMKTLADLNNNILDIHEKKAAVKKSDTEEKAPIKATQNNFFYGTPAEMNKMIAKHSGKVFNSDEE